MSYTKLLRIIIEVYSSALDYPEEEKVRVWLKDGNIPYMSFKHLLLVVVTSLVLVLFFLPYTLLLLLGYKLYRFTGRKYFHWFSRIKPLLESYYAPYKSSSRYWTGLLLLVRCLLFVIFSFGGTRKSLLAIITTFTALGFLTTGRIYKRVSSNVLETLLNFNLVILSAATQAEFNSPTLAYSLVGMVFATMVCVTAYQFHLLYIAKTAPWLRLKTKMLPYMLQFKSQPKTEISLPIRSHDQPRFVSKTVIDLREPLIEA